MPVQLAHPTRLNFYQRSRDRFDAENTLVSVIRALPLFRLVHLEKN
jgi:hypothetical protein